MTDIFEEFGYRNCEEALDSAIVFAFPETVVVTKGLTIIEFVEIVEAEREFGGFEIAFPTVESLKGRSTLTAVIHQ